MVLESGEIVLWATLFGLMIGIIWSLKYIVIIDRRIERLEERLTGRVRNIAKDEKTELRILRKGTRKPAKKKAAKKTTRKKTTKKKTTRRRRK